MPANDTYGETTPQEHASMRANASACLTCGMLATVDPVSHQGRYGHVPVIAGDAGSLVWSADRLSWIPAEIRRATAADAGCYVDGSWGQYSTAHLVARAEEFGYADERVSDLAARHLATMGRGDGVPLSDEESEELDDAADSVEAWLNDHAAPESHTFGWFEGEFYLWPDETWAEYTA